MRRFSIKLIVSSIGWCALIGIASAVPVTSSVTGPITGEVTLTVDAIQAYHTDGSPDPNPKHNKQCKRLYKRWLRGNVTMSANYSINPHTNIESAMTTINGIQTILSAMGLSEKYSFLATLSHIDPELQNQGVQRIRFTIDHAINNASAESEILLRGNSPKGPEYCLIMAHPS